MQLEVPDDPLDRQLVEATGNWEHSRWRGHVLWQNLLDLNVISEYLLERRPDVVIETGTWRGGSAIFFADMMRLSGRDGDVLTIDHNPRATPAYPGVTYLAGRSSIDRRVIADVAAHVQGRRAFVVLDSDHSGAHVLAELEAYARFILPGDYLLVQDGNVYRSLGWSFEKTPLWGIERFLASCHDFKVDAARSPFATTAHPCGWLRRIL